MFQWYNPESERWIFGWSTCFSLLLANIFVVAPIHLQTSSLSLKYFLPNLTILIDTEAHSTLVHFVSKNEVLLWSKEFEGVLVFDTKLNQFSFSFVFIKFHSILETKTLYVKLHHYSQISRHHYLIILSYFEMDFNR